MERPSFVLREAGLSAGEEARVRLGMHGPDRGAPWTLEVRTSVEEHCSMFVADESFRRALSAVDDVDDAYSNVCT